MAIMSRKKTDRQKSEACVLGFDLPRWQENLICQAIIRLMARERRIVRQSLQENK